MLRISKSLQHQRRNWLHLEMRWRTFCFEAGRVTIERQADWCEARTGDKEEFGLHCRSLSSWTKRFLLPLFLPGNITFRATARGVHCRSLKLKIQEHFSKKTKTNQKKKPNQNYIYIVAYSITYYWYYWYHNILRPNSFCGLAKSLITMYHYYVPLESHSEFQTDDLNF